MEDKQKTENALSIINSGVACFALVFLDSLGILEKLKNFGKVSKSDFESSNDILIIDRALLELELNKLLIKENDIFILTPIGQELLNYLGLILYIYNGYCNLLSNPKDHYKINYRSIIRGSNLLGKRFIDKTILKVLKELNIEGTICDLGCGDGQRLSNICEKFNCSGLGFELEVEALGLIENKLHKNVHIQEADISQLNGVWNDVKGLLQVMVMHDFTPDNIYIKIMNSFQDHFPNINYFLYCDIVAPSDSFRTQLPGFDYIHSLLGIRTKTYGEIMDLFNKTDFEPIKEIAIDKMPNTFLWVLVPRKSKIY